MKKDKRKIIFILSLLIIVIATSTIWAFIKINNKAVEIQANKSEFNTELEENEHIHIEDINGEKVPVPNGYVGSKADGENGIYTGYVIYEGEEEVTNANVEEAQKTRNQYVWIPVPDVSKFYGIDENGKKWGKLYDFTTETGDDIDELTGAKPLNWSERDGIMKITSKTSYMEPGITISNKEKGYDIDSTLKMLKMTDYISHDFLIQLEKEFNNMLESVERYEGFYIGRYETGNLSKKNSVIRKGNTYIGGQIWYSDYEKCKNIKGENANVETGIIWGNQWDRVLIWLIETKNKTKEEICVDSSGWGNSNKSTFEYINNNGEIVKKEKGEYISIPTGNSEYTKANNIYDLAGNRFEFTMESSSMGRFYRGGSFSYNITSDYRYYADPTLAYNISCRAMLYIK